jgi:hypothetical protein
MVVGVAFLWAVLPRLAGFEEQPGANLIYFTCQVVKIYDATPNIFSLFASQTSFWRGIDG